MQGYGPRRRERPPALSRCGAIAAANLSYANKLCYKQLILQINFTTRQINSQLDRYYLRSIPGG